MLTSRPEKQGLLAWMAGNHVAANLLMFIFLIGGLISATKITQEVFPSYDLDIVNISVRYPGASPEEVEEGVILAVEEEVRDLENVERVTAVAKEGSASISVELLSGADPNKTSRISKTVSIGLPLFRMRWSGRWSASRPGDGRSCALPSMATLMSRVSLIWPKPSAKNSLPT